MKINISKANIPPWISCHTYNYETENSRTYISNEKRHEYIQLDGLSSDIWKMIYDKKDNNVFFSGLTKKV